MHVFHYRFAGSFDLVGVDSRFYGDNFVFPSVHSGHRLEFAEVFGFVDEFCKLNFSVFDDGFEVRFADLAGDYFVGVTFVDFERVSAFGAFEVHVCACVLAAGYVV